MRKLLSKIGWYSFTEGIQNLIYWLPVIWRDRNFDHNYFYRILLHKLTYMESFFRSDNAWTVEAKACADQIKEAKECVWRLLNDDYFTVKVEDINTDEIFSFKDKVFTTDREHPDYLRWKETYNQADIDRENDKKKLFELLNQHIENWWD